MFIHRFVLLTTLFFISCNHNPKSKDVDKEMEKTTGQSVTKNTAVIINDDQNCDIDIVAFTKKNIETLDQKNILKFLKGLKSDCENNVEFSQFSNTVLFMLLNNKTQELLKSIYDNQESLEVTYIIKMVSNPVSDQFDLREIKTKVKSSKTDNSLKLQILKAIPDNN